MVAEPRGLTSDEAARRLAAVGPNAVPEQRRHLLLSLAAKLWGPVPWMLEATVALELALGRRLEAAIVAVLLVFNAVMSGIQERRARSAVALLRQRLVVQVRALRDGQWSLVPAETIVPGDVVHLRMGDIVPADVGLVDGQVLVDQSALTGESLPVDLRGGATAYAGAQVKRGEASGEVTATGQRTFFGRTAELVQSARTASHLQSLIVSIVTYLVAMDVVLIAALLGYAVFAGLPYSETLPFALILLVASVPVALPATFTLATALGGVELARRGVLVTRLSAIEEAAAMDVLCSDKTGTITENRLRVAAVRPRAPFSELDVLRFAAQASDEATQDPIDLAILSQARERGVATAMGRRQAVVPFDPATKIAETVIESDGHAVHTLKGAPRAVLARLADPPDVEGDVQRLGAEGYRVLAVATGSRDRLQLVGLVALHDPPRGDSRALIAGLADMGVRVLLVTGDSLATARTVAAQVGIDGPACSAQDLRRGGAGATAYGVFAEVLPEDKFNLVRALQEAGHIVGMTGDGVNDAPALTQSEVGIAVANATDVAKASASLVLTTPGLTDMLAAIETSRRIYQRMLTYTLNKIIKTVEIAFFLTLGVIATGTFIITPLLVLLLLFTNDFVTMSIATDHVSFSRRPDRWRIRPLMENGLILASFILLLSLAVFFVGRDALHLSLPHLHTLVFLTLVFTGQGTVYLIRERGHLWQSRPSRWMVISSVADIVIVSLLAIRGVLMAPLPLEVVAALLATVLVYLVLLDLLKVAILRRGSGAR
ncbi:plasma-membrane proton-efflux P-type ATPase [bacterium]|nr:plasma-membrane proton-efflux P-type ATPase [bacterium]